MGYLCPVNTSMAFHSTFISGMRQNGFWKIITFSVALTRFFSCRLTLSRDGLWVSGGVPPLLTKWGSLVVLKDWYTSKKILTFAITIRLLACVDFLHSDVGFFIKSFATFTVLTRVSFSCDSLMFNEVCLLRTEFATNATHKGLSWMKSHMDYKAQLLIDAFSTFSA